jgi:TolB-like protein
LKGIIDKLNKEEKVPSYIVTSMHGLNSLATYGAHPKDFDPDQVKPAISNLAIIIKWYLNYKGIVVFTKPSLAEQEVITVEGKNIPDTNKLEKSIAVLPFINDSPDQENTYFINGVMEEILNNLQRIKELRVISRTSVEQYRVQSKPIPEIAEELGVNYIVEGSGQKYGNSFRLRAQLIMATKETHLWGESFQQKITEVEDIFKIQTKIAETIADELKAVITPEEKQLIEKVPTSNNEAYEAYIKGRFYLQNINQNNLDISQKHFELAIEKDPTYAYAYTGIAYIWLIRQQSGFTIPEEAGPKAMEAILKAAELDSNIAEVHFMQACINYLGVWDWKTSESEFLKALEINPNHAEAHGLYAQLLYILGRPKEAIKHSEFSSRLDPMNQLVKMWYGFNFLYEKRYDDTISIYREVLKLDPNNYPFYSGISEACHLKGQLEEALESTKLYYINWYPDIDHVFDQYTKLGYSGVMNLEGDLLAKQSEKKYVIPADIVELYGMAGNKEKTLEWIEKGYELRDPVTPYIGRPFFTSLLINEPRYHGLLSKLNIPYYD